MRKLREVLSEHKNKFENSELGFQLGPMRIKGILEEVCHDGVVIRADDDGAFVVPFEKPDCWIFPGDPEKAAELEREQATKKPILVPGIQHPPGQA